MEFRGDILARITCGTGPELVHARTLQVDFRSAFCVGFRNNQTEFRRLVPVPKFAMALQIDTFVPVGVQAFDILVL